jgi:deoxyribodipyrimidine photo-lyase
MFVRKWVPEIAMLPNEFIHHPWTLTVMEADMYGFKPGIDYPLPIVSPDEKDKPMVDRLWEKRKTPEARAEAGRVIRTMSRPGKRGS